MYRHILLSTLIILLIAVFTSEAVNYWQVRNGVNTVKQRNSNKALPMRHFWARGGNAARGLGVPGLDQTNDDYINPFVRRQLEAPNADQDFRLKYR